MKAGATKKHLEKVAREASILGFNQNEINPHLFWHPDFPETSFDLSATDPKKIILVVWNEGKKQGRLETQLELCNTLGVKHG